jgi:tripartite-type tricarboxylate transporter receptor subunit TctC
MLALLSLIAAAVGPASAETWPSRPIRLIVPHAPGGVTDVVARLVAQPLGEALGQSVFIENRPGASGLVGTESAANAPADGYTFVMFVDANTILPSIMKQLHHDPLKSFAPITVLGRGSHVFVAHPSLPVHTLSELIAYAKQHPRELSYASPGLGSPQNLSVEIIKNAVGIDIVHIPYKGGGQAISDVVSGQVKLGILGMAPTLSYVKSGKLTALAVTGAKRATLLPNVPTVSEATVPGFATAQWQGICAPAGTPTAIVERMHDELVHIMNSPDIVERLAAIGMDNSTSASPADFSEMIASELERWPAVVKLAGIQPE